MSDGVRMAGIAYAEMWMASGWRVGRVMSLCLVGVAILGTRHSSTFQPRSVPQKSTDIELPYPLIMINKKCM